MGQARGSKPRRDVSISPRGPISAFSFGVSSACFEVKGEQWGDCLACGRTEFRHRVSALGLMKEVSSVRVL